MVYARTRMLTAAMNINQTMNKTKSATVMMVFKIRMLRNQEDQA